MSKPRRATFEVATDKGYRQPPGRAPRTGYVLGDFAVHRDRFFWTLTHLPTGLSINQSPPLEGKAAALAKLEGLARDGLEPRHAAHLAGRGWGGEAGRPWGRP